MRDLTLADAIVFATEAHRGQVNKFNGEPYILHPLEVMSKFCDLDLKIVAVLHDVVEDTEATLNDIWNEFGKEIGEAVDAITHRDYETNMEYWKRVAANDWAYKVKLADVRINSERNVSIEDKATRERLEQKYKDAYKFLMEYRNHVEWKRSNGFSN